MKICLLYTGYLRTWDQCRANHQMNIYSPDTDLFFYTYEKPEGVEFKQWVQIPKPYYPDPFKAHKYNERKRQETSVFQSLNQWCNNFVGFRTLPLGYDIYVRIRPDIKFNGRLNFTDFDVSGNNIYIPEGHDYGGCSDLFGFGNYNVMEKYYSVFLNCHRLWNDGAEFHSEGMQMTNLRREGVNIVRYGHAQIDIIR